MKVFSSIKKMISIKATNREAGRISLCVLIAVLIFIASPAWSADYYIAQTAAGNNNATSCANAKAISYLTGSWSGKVSAGDTVHLCGSLTSPLAVGGSGLSGSPITIKFEDGAGFTAAYWSSIGAIYIDRKNNINIDGGTNGYIKNTANGSALANQQASNGIYAASTSNLEIKNMTIRNMYVHIYNASDQAACTGIYVYSGSNVKIHDNILTESLNGIIYNKTDYTTTSMLEIYNNTVSRTTWGIGIGSGGLTSILNGAKIYNNNITMGSNWVGQGQHINGMYIYGSDGTVNDLYIYNNYVHAEAVPDGTWAASGFIHHTSTYSNVVYVFNNLLVGGTLGGPTNGYIDFYGVATAGGPSPVAVYVLNNTVIGTGDYKGFMQVLDGGDATIKNNVFYNLNIGVQYSGTGYSMTADNNNYYSNTRVSYNGTWLTSLDQFQTALGGCPGTGHECNSIATNPSLNSNYTEQASSPTVGAGVNLTSLGITALNSDKSGIARPSSAAWNIGAYVPTSTTKPKAPRNLRITR